MIQTKRLQIVPFEMKFLKDYCEGFNTEIAKYQWPDPFETPEDAKPVLQGFMDEMEAEETLFYSILNSEGKFVGSVEVHGLSGECPELGVWITEQEQKKGYAYEALSEVLDYACRNYHKEAFFYEADIRNEGSTKLLHKLGEHFDILKRDLEELTTDSGKELKLQGYVLKVKEI